MTDEPNMDIAHLGHLELLTPTFDKSRHRIEEGQQPLSTWAASVPVMAQGSQPQGSRLSEGAR
jgi:hypothetical protein